MELSVFEIENHIFDIKLPFSIFILFCLLLPFFFILIFFSLFLTTVSCSVEFYTVFLFFLPSLPFSYSLLPLIYIIYPYFLTIIFFSGEFYAIETFGTTGRGWVVEDGECSHYMKVSTYVLVAAHYFKNHY